MRPGLLATRAHLTTRRRPLSRRAFALLLPALLALLLSAGPRTAAAAPPAPGDTASPICTPRTTPVPAGPATLTSATTVAGTGGRLRDLTLSSPALGGPTHVNLLLPAGFDASRATRYPVLYLLHGAAGAYSDWITQGTAQTIIDQVTQARHLPPFITVMPDAGTWGFYNDWYGADLDGTPTPVPGWTAYHIHELIPWIDANYPTNASRNGRVIAGLSMGGYGAMSYASRFPDLFSTAASFSGAVDPDLNYPLGNAELNLLAPAFSGGHMDQCVWGDEITQDVRWRGGNPTYLARSLSNTHLFIASGGGQPTAPTTLAGDPVEESVYMQSQSLVSALDAAGIPHVDDFYGSGTHSWSYWQSDLREFLPLMAADLASPPVAPAARPFSYRSIEPSFSTWGWNFATDHAVTEFTYLEDVTTAGLTVAGSGTLGVVTPAAYTPLHTYTVTAAGTARKVVADGSGRLTFQVDLGPRHTSEQTAFDAATIASWTTRRVTIADAGRAASAGSGSAGGATLPNTGGDGGRDVPPVAALTLLVVALGAARPRRSPA